MTDSSASALRVRRVRADEWELVRALRLEALDDPAASIAFLEDAALTLDVHVDNARAEAAYARNGFARTGVETTEPIGDERELRRALR